MPAPVGGGRGAPVGGGGTSLPAPVGGGRGAPVEQCGLGPFGPGGLWGPGGPGGPGLGGCCTIIELLMKIKYIYPSSRASVNCALGKHNKINVISLITS